MYDAGMAHPKPRKDQENDPLFPTTDPLLQKLSLTKEEKVALKAFLLTLSSPSARKSPQSTLKVDTKLLLIIDY